MTGRGQAQRGFTILEIMIAILILSVSVVSIFGAQFGAVSTVEFARGSTMAMQLARCRMSEVELKVVTEGGFVEGDVNENGDCCEMLAGEADVTPYTCRTELKTVELPDISNMMSGGPDGGLLDSVLGLGSGGGLMGAGGGDMVTSLAPMITDLLKQAIRRATVVVEWKQGARNREVTITQYLVHPTQGPLQLLQGAAAMDEANEAALDQTGLGATSGPSGGRSMEGTP
ncbi:MAG: prepilin-type N-terminal cleavage/methylation domain-containing protein [Deltaproteobacteria bacterium]|nr:prepilin-type N-terminal cleavage/methylation domain-containing protein [Deltaproteobacteria bacterium]